MRKLKLASLLIALIVGIALVVANSHEVSVRFLVTTLTIPMALVLLIVFALGFVAGGTGALLMAKAPRGAKPSV